MQHPDEGTIHAWLDGALGEAEAGHVAAHVAACPECEARVVEARGLIAGASRVLSALDAVPAGVIPPSRGIRVGEGPSRDRAPIAPAREPRRWWRRRGISPALAAAAAVAFVAVGSALVVRTAASRRGESLAATRVVAGPPAVTEAMPQAPAASPASSTPSDSSLAAAAPTAAPQLPARVVESGVSPAPRIAPSPVASGARVARGPAAKSAPPAERPMPDEGAASRRVAESSAPDSAYPAKRSLGDRGRTVPLSEVVVTNAPAAADREASRPAVRMRTTDAVRATAAPEAGAFARAAVAPRPQLVPSFAGCYRVVEGDVGAMPRRFVLDTVPLATLLSDSAATQAQAQAPALALARVFLARADQPGTTGTWTATGPTARVAWLVGGARFALDLRADTSARFTGRFTADGRTSVVALERCDQR